MNRDFPNGGHHPNANEPPVYSVNQGGQAYSAYPQVHGAQMHYQNGQQVVMAYPQQQPMMPQQAMMHHQNMAPQQQYMVPMVQPNFLPQQRQWVMTAPPQTPMMPQWVGPVGQQVQQPFYGGGHQSSSAPRQQGFSPRQQSNARDGANASGPQRNDPQGRHRNGNSSDNASYHHQGAAPSRQVQELSPLPGRSCSCGLLHNPTCQRRERINGNISSVAHLTIPRGSITIINQSVELRSNSGDFELWADKEHPLLLTLSSLPKPDSIGAASDELKAQVAALSLDYCEEDPHESGDAPSQPEVIQVKESTEEPNVQPENPESMQGPVQAQETQLQKTPEEPIQQEPVTKILVQQPTVDEAALRKAEEFALTYAKMARPQKAQQPVIRSAPKTVQPLPKRAPQIQRPRQPLPNVQSPPMISPQDDSPWTFVGPSSSGPSSSSVQAEPVLVLKAPPPRPKETDRVEEQERVSEEEQDAPVKNPKETGTSASRKKKAKKAGKPTQSKAEKEAQDKADFEVLEEAIKLVKGEPVPKDSVATYIETHNAIRATMVKEGLQIDSVDTSGLEQAMLTWFLNNKYAHWPFERDSMRVFLVQNRNARAKSHAPEDKVLVRKYDHLLDLYSMVVTQDLFALRSLYPNNLTSALENEYFDLVFDPDRDVLVLNCLSKKIRAALRTPQQEQLNFKITLYARGQERHRAEDDLVGVFFKNDIERWLNINYFKNKTEFREILSTNRESLVKTYYRYWNWQYHQQAQQLPRDDNYEAKLVNVFSLASRDVSNPANDVLICDTHMISLNQARLYKQAPIDQLVDQSSQYITLIFSLH